MIGARRLARRGGVKRISALIYEDIRQALENHLRNVRAPEMSGQIADTDALYLSAPSRLLYDGRLRATKEYVTPKPFSLGCN
jgi:hypothetical protein